jgi:hypothetical protein
MLSIDLLLSVEPEPEVRIDRVPYYAHLRHEAVERATRSLARALPGGSSCRVLAVDYSRGPGIREALERACRELPAGSELIHVEPAGRAPSHAETYRLCLPRCRGNLVYLSRGEFLYQPAAIARLLEEWRYFLHRFGHSSFLLSPHDDPESYAAGPVASAVVRGLQRHWRDGDALPRAFLAPDTLIHDHWDFFESLADPSGSAGQPYPGARVGLRERGVPVLTPMPALAVQLGQAAQEDPYVDWRGLWHAAAAPGAGA